MKGNIIIVALSMFVLSSCATTTTSNDCNMDNLAYKQAYEQTLKNGQSEVSALKMGSYACKANKIGKWAAK